jgi:hypothetical protein
MQMSGMSYIHVLQMPVDDMCKYIDWKIKYDQDVEKAKQKALDELKSQRKSRRH